MLNIKYFKKLKDFFTPDGTLRDIYIKQTDQKDWKKFLKYIKKYRTLYLEDDKRIRFPQSIDDFFEKNKTKLLEIHIGNISINCHFFAADEIELDVDPKEFSDREDFENLLFFITEIARTLNKNVILTEENSEDSPFLIYNIRRDKLEIY